MGLTLVLSGQSLPTTSGQGHRLLHPENRMSEVFHKQEYKEMCKQNGLSDRLPLGFIVQPLLKTFEYIYKKKNI